MAWQRLEMQQVAVHYTDVLFSFVHFNSKVTLYYQCFHSTLGVLLRIISALCSSRHWRHALAIGLLIRFSQLTENGNESVWLLSAWDLSLDELLARRNVARFIWVSTCDNLKVRNPRDTLLLCERDARFDFRLGFVRLCEPLCTLLCIVEEASLCAYTAKLFWVAGVTCLLEIVREQNFQELLLRCPAALFQCAVHQTVAEQGAPDRTVVVELDAVLSTMRSHLLFHGGNSVSAKARLIALTLVHRLIEGQGRVQLIRQKFDLGGREDGRGRGWVRDSRLRAGRRSSGDEGRRGDSLFDLPQAKEAEWAD